MFSIYRDSSLKISLFRRREEGARAKGSSGVKFRLIHGRGEQGKYDLSKAYAFVYPRGRSFDTRAIAEAYSPESLFEFNLETSHGSRIGGKSS